MNALRQIQNRFSTCGDVWQIFQSPSGTHEPYSNKAFSFQRDRILGPLFGFQMVKVLKPSDVTKAGPLAASSVIIGKVVRVHIRALPPINASEEAAGKNKGTKGRGSTNKGHKSKGSADADGSRQVLELYVCAGLLPSQVILMEIWDAGRIETLSRQLTQ